MTPLSGPLLRRALAFFLPVAMLLTIVAALVDGTVQSDERSSANEPQLQIASDIAARLNAGVPPRLLAAGPTVNLAVNLATHVTVYDNADRVLASTARLNGAIPTPPKGVLDDARRSGRDTPTWQPQPGVRVAAVVVPWRGGTVLVGRSLAPTESWEDDLNGLCIIGWLIGIVLLALTALAASWLWPASPATPWDARTTSGSSAAGS